MKKLTIISLILITFIACKKQHNVIDKPAYQFANILILGNSITYAPANPGIGWNGSWGMAASAPQYDYVHLLTQHFVDGNKSATVAAKNIADFETGYTTYDLSQLATYRDAKPDLIIIRIGENVQPDYDPVVFEQKYKVLIDYLKQNNPSVKVFAAGSFWGNAAVDQIMAKYSPFISLAPLGKDMSNYAWGLFDNSGIQQHPCDKGMKAISDAIWQGIEKLK